MLSILSGVFFGMMLQVQKPVVSEDMIKKEVQYHALLKELRCLVCQNQDLADSNANLAKDLRKQVHQLVWEGQTDKEIKAYLQVRYGDFILFKPPLNNLTLFLWFGPFFLLFVGVLMLYKSTRKRLIN